VKKLLIQLDTDSMPSVFDTVVAYDAGVDHVLAYGGVTAENVRDFVYGAMFTRSNQDLKNTAIFIGGSQVATAQEVLTTVQKTFFGSVRVSVLMDANGCNTTAAAAVIKINRAYPVAGQKALVMAGTGPVGLRVAALLSLGGGQVTLTSRSMARAEAACQTLAEQYKVVVEPLKLNPNDQQAAGAALADKAIVVTTGALGAVLLTEETWAGAAALRVVADLNAVPPGGVTGLKLSDDGKRRQGKICFGALGIGGLKMKIHKTAVDHLFTRNDVFLDAQEVYSLGQDS
jgi:threonine dehydrogenase-like Zn-dependent dehydrogenase